MGMFDKMKDKASELAGQHGDQVEEYSDQGLDRGEQMAEDRFGDQHADQVDKGRDMLDERIGDRSASDPADRGGVVDSGEAGAYGGDGGETQPPV